MPCPLSLIPSDATALGVGRHQKRKKKEKKEKRDMLHFATR
jgi:hypothetical protein